jgi:hypothetical protein
MHHRMRRWYSAAMTPRAVKFGRIGGDGYARANARPRLASGDTGCARRGVESFTSTAATVLWPQHVALWRMAEWRRGVPLPLFFGKQNEQFLAPPPSFAWSLPLPLRRGEARRWHPLEISEVRMGTCELREGGRGFGKNKSMWRARPSGTRYWKEGRKIVRFIGCRHLPTAAPRSTGARESHRAGGGASL